ncbi:MAG: P-loop NTPase [Planctomycetota bacterium]
MKRIQGNKRRGLSARRSHRAQVIVVVSGKGGVGKTNLSLNLRIDLSRRGKRVILLDADFGLANADILLDVSPMADMSDLSDTSRSLQELLVRGPDGLRVLCGVSGLTRGGQPPEVDAATCSRAVRRLVWNCDIVVVDCGTGVTPPIAAFAMSADLLVVVTTPEPTALTDAYATLKLLHIQGFDGRVGAVVNMTNSRTEAVTVTHRLSQVARRFLGLPIEDLGYIATDRHVPAAVRQRVPVLVRYPRCSASACIAEVSRRIAPPIANLAARQGVWARVASLFL